MDGDIADWVAQTLDSEVQLSYTFMYCISLCIRKPKIRLLHDASAARRLKLGHADYQLLIINPRY